MLTSNLDQTHDGAAGFSLMEMLVVLAIMGLMLSIVSVQLVRTIESAYFSKTADAAMADLLLLRADAVLRRENRVLITDSSRFKESNDIVEKSIRRLKLPQGWSATGEAIRISDTGICFGGKIVITDSEGRRAAYTLNPPRCEAFRSEEIMLSQNSKLLYNDAFVIDVEQQLLESP